MWYAWAVVGAVFCAALALRATRLITSALWLTGVSALTAITLYGLGAHEVAVIELSVGTGLVTVLLVFAIGITGNDAADTRAILPRPLAWSLVILTALLLGWMTLPLIGVRLPGAESSFASALWDQRGLDVLVQIALLFTGALGVLGLLADAPAPRQSPAGQPSAPRPLDAAPGTAVENAIVLIHEGHEGHEDRVPEATAAPVPQEVAR